MKKYPYHPLSEKKDEESFAGITPAAKDKEQDDGRPDREERKGPPHVAVKEGPKCMQQTAAGTGNA
jgi:hypothetical protein